MRKPTGFVLELDKYFHGEEKDWAVDYLAKVRFEELNIGEEAVEYPLRNIEGIGNGYSNNTQW